MQYLKERRAKLGGSYPVRRQRVEPLHVPELEFFKSQLEGSGDREFSTTMAFVRILTALIRDKNIGSRIVPIVPDEARTFGMEGMFRQVGIYSSLGQLYTPQDSDQLSYYRERQEGPDSRGRHQRGRLVLLVDRGRHVVREPWRADDSFLYLLLDVRLPAHRRFRVGRRRHARARLPARRHGGPHDARGRGLAAPGRPQPARRDDDSELPRLRPVLQLRARGHHPRRLAAHVRGAGERLLLHHRDERELRASGHAGRRRRPASCAACIA